MNSGCIHNFWIQQTNVVEPEIVDILFAGIG